MPHEPVLPVMTPIVPEGGAVCATIVVVVSTILLYRPSKACRNTIERLLPKAIGITDGNPIGITDGNPTERYYQDEFRATSN
jgi:hypothetical protein